MEFRRGSLNGILLAMLLASTGFVGGCAVTRCEESLIHPHPEGKPFQECSIDPNEYKSVQLRPRQDSTIALAVAASGGGYRAANFAAGALLGLEEITKGGDAKTNVLSQVDYFSSVSGGGFAVGAYISTLYDHLYFAGTTDGYSFAEAMGEPNVNCPCKHIPAAAEEFDPCVKRHLQGLYHDFIKDFLRTILPWEQLGFENRGRRFERAIDDDILGYRWRRNKLAAMPAEEIYGSKDAGRNASLTLSDVFVCADDVVGRVTMPYWVTNATIYENGAIFTFTPDMLSSYRVDGYGHQLQKYAYAAYDGSYHQFIMQIPLAVGVTSSGNFPFAMPANALTNKMDPNNPYLYLLDGGMADNLGVVTAVRLLEAESQPRVTRKILIVIDSYQGGLAPYSSTKKPPSVAKTAVRAMEISLDSWRGRYREMTDTLCRTRDINTVYLSFDDLADADFNDLLPFGLTQEDIRQLLKIKPKDCPKATPFYYVRSISMVSPVTMTKQGLEYRLPAAQQNLLLAAGRYIADKKRPEILAALGWD